MANNDGAIPKTPFNSPRKLKIKDTPTKSNVTCSYGDIIENHVCVLCDNNIEKPRERVKLYHNVTEKTDTCHSVENVLKITIDSIFYKSIVCRKCVREYSTLEQRENQCNVSRTLFRSNIDKAKQSLQAHYERSTVKRMSNSPVKAKKKICGGKFDIHDKENLVPKSLSQKLAFNQSAKPDNRNVESKPKIVVSTNFSL